jgi:hypothetical protein
MLSGMLLMAVAPANAQVVVLSSRGPSAATYPQGAVLQADRVVELKAGDRLELLDAAGSHVVTGPATLPAGHIDGGARARLIDIFSKGQHARPGIAATRGFALRGAETGGLWQADVSEGGAACVLNGRKPAFARADEGAPAPVSIVRLADGSAHAVTWPAGAVSAEWPADLPVADGERYAIALDDGSSADLTWRTVDAVPSGVEALAADLLAKGCYAQLERLRAGLGSE